MGRELARMTDEVGQERRDGHGRGRGREQGEHVRVVASGDRRVRERQDVGQRIQREYSARNKNVDTDDSCYSIFGSYLTDEKMNVKNVHFSETNSQVGNTVVCLDMSGSQSGSLSGKVVTVADILTKPLRYERYGRSTDETMPDKEKKAERSRRKAELEGDRQHRDVSHGAQGGRVVGSTASRSSDRPRSVRKGTQPNKGRERNPTKEGNATQQSKGTKPNSKARERNPRTKQGNETQEQNKGTRPEDRRGTDPKNGRGTDPKTGDRDDQPGPVGGDDGAAVAIIRAHSGEVGRCLDIPAQLRLSGRETLTRLRMSGSVSETPDERERRMSVTPGVCRHLERVILLGTGSYVSAPGLN